MVDLDATLVTAHSEKQDAAPTWKKGYGFHPLCAFVAHGPAGTGEPLAVLLRPGNAGSNTASDHIAVTRDALAQLPKGFRSGRKVLVRTDSAGGTKEFLHWLAGPGRNLGYSVGLPIHGALEYVLPLIPEKAWARAYNSDGQERDGAWVAEVTGMLDLAGWPAGMRVIVRREVPHPGAQLRITDIEGMRYTAFATNQARGQVADLETRHRLRARCEDRIRAAKDTGLQNLPLHAFHATPSGATWSCSPPSSPPEHRCSPSTTPRQGAGNPNGSALVSLRSPAGPAPTPRAPSCTSPPRRRRPSSCGPSADSPH